jgi:hypothetical protein
MDTDPDACLNFLSAQVGEHVVCSRLSRRII